MGAVPRPSVDDILGTGGALAATAGGFEPRAGQRALAARWPRSSRRAGSCWRRPGPAPARRWPTWRPPSPPGGRVVISTATRTLQDQIVRKDVPRLQAAVGSDVVAAVLKGRSNYLCLWRLEPFSGRTRRRPASGRTGEAPAVGRRDHERGPRRARRVARGPPGLGAPDDDVGDLPRRPLPALCPVLRHAGPRRGRSRRSRRGQSPPVLRRRGRAGGGGDAPARARRGGLRRGARRAGDRRAVLRGARLDAATRRLSRRPRRRARRRADEFRSGVGRPHRRARGRGRGDASLRRPARGRRPPRARRRVCPSVPRPSRRPFGTRTSRSTRRCSTSSRASTGPKTRPDSKRSACCAGGRVRSGTTSSDSSSRPLRGGCSFATSGRRGSR
jgi:hypothetical protein